MTTLPRNGLADSVAALLLERIRGGEWPLGSKLPSENTLAPQLEVGRSTVREAIRQLAGQGVLKSRQGAGVFVTALDVPPRLDETVTAAAITHVLQARLAIEVEAAALAALQRSRSDLAEIRAALAARAEAGALESYVDADMRFHQGIVAAAGNPILREIFDTFVPRIRRAMIAMLRRHPLNETEDQRAHEALAEAIEAGDAPAARARAREHLQRLADRVGH